MSGLDTSVLIIYALGVTAFGSVFYRRASTQDGFTKAGGRLPGWVVGLSIFGTYLSSISFLALPGKAYSSNWNAFAFSLSLPFAAWAASKWFAPLYRQTGDVSAYAYLERRFGLPHRLYAMSCYLLTQMARLGTILFLVALALEGLTGWDIRTIILATGILVTLYTVIGGIEAVIWTDAVQSAVLTAGALACAVTLIIGVPGGGFLSISGEKLSLGSFGPDLTEPTFWVVFIYGVVINLQNFGIDQSYVQRYQAARSLADARRSVWIGALAYIPVSALFLFIGTALFAYYTARPDLLPPELSAAGAGDRVFPHFIVTELPAGIRGLIIAALFAAAMSSADSSLNSSATILLTDVYLRFVNRDAAERRRVTFLRVMTLILGAAGTGTALLMISIKSALDAWWSLAGIFSGGMLGLFLLAAFSRRTGAGHAAAAVAMGIAVILWATISRGTGGALENPFHPFMTAVLGTAAILLAGGVLSRGRGRRRISRPARTIFDL